MENVSMNDVSELILGMLFNSEQDAYDYYNSYGRTMGFSVRKHFLNKSKKDKMTITFRGFVCSKPSCRLSDKRDINIVNPRAETRTNCQARMNIYLVDDEKYKCCDFVREHNHELHITATVHMMHSQRNMLDIHRQEIDLADDSGIRPRSTVELMGRQVGGIGNLSCLTQDVRNYLRTKRQRALTYCEMIIDYAQFGDVVSFDTTFRTNKECRLFGLFAGFNHHRGCTVFGAALLYGEIVESFEWLFDVFAEAHSGKKPITIFTDQDKAMRWTRGARTMVVNDSRGKKVEQDVNLDCTQRYKHICPELIHIALEASNTIEGYNLVKDAANELRLKLGNIIINPVDCPDMPILPDFSDDDSISHISSQASVTHQSLDEDYN
ncbi:protein FAR1-RELATED SEQUENCE 5-like [Macadamia integrifolia]|uniref:protein FAR1-RELATED SEQUENCE 5-like n=1 Tax=Macadamia integrifolia TaxID=60698 RepID=UPI001C4E3D35|nr:protein FAR1-RELATED SEQUENCE 5-like [Macadamia integrifolia]